MNTTYIASFVILLLVFSVTIAVTRPQPASVSISSISSPAGPSFIERLTNNSGLFGGASGFSVGGSHPKKNPKDNYQCFFESCSSFFGNLGTFVSGNRNTGNSGTNLSGNSGSNVSGSTANGSAVNGINFGIFGNNTARAQSTTPTAQTGTPPTSFVLQGPDQTRDFVMDEALFTFGGFVPGTTEEVTFETRLLGGNNYDEQWKGTSKKEITYKLDIKGIRTMTFEVRAKTKDGRVDATPASWTFRLAHSQLWREVTISSVRSGSTQFSNEQVSIYNRTSKNIPITGWRLAELTSQASIGTGVEIVQPIRNYNAFVDISLPAYGSAVIYSGQSPLGFSWRDNSCSFYLSNGQLENNQKYSDCYFKENLKSDFLKSKWNIYLNLGASQWDEHSTFFLYDKFGAVVDVKKY